MARRIIDSQLRVSAALPNAANTTSTNVIDLGAVTPYPTTDRILVHIYNAAGGVGANTKNINIRLMHSAESNANFTNIAERTIPLLKLTEAGGSVYPVGEISDYLPPTVKQYIKAAALGEANGGDASNAVFYLEVVT